MSLCRIYRICDRKHAPNAMTKDSVMLLPVCLHFWEGVLMTGVSGDPTSRTKAVSSDNGISSLPKGSLLRLVGTIRNQ